MRSLKIGKTITFLIICIICTTWISTATAGDKDWAVSVYSGRLVDGDLGQTLIFNTPLLDATFLAATLSKRFYTLWEWIDLEVEGQVVKHIRDQYHWEFNALTAARFHVLPPEWMLDFSPAFGVGLSYATELPTEEVILTNDNTQKLLCYLMFEFDFAIPKKTNISLFARVHHRSGAYGTFGGVTGASNAWALGLKYRF
jgi:hypothetical protein